MLPGIFSTFASVVTIGFGIWHFFVPAVWRWYDYIAGDGAELATAVRAVNVFFSLCLVLTGVINLVFTYAPKRTVFAFNVMMAASCVLWLMRVVMQIIYPQGSINPWMQYGMLSGFLLIFLCFLAALVLPKAW